MLVLAISRVPIYLRTTRAEILEIRERMFVTAARVMGARPRGSSLRHIVPMVLPTLITLATLEFASVMLSESRLSFLGLGIQPPGITWGLMVAEGRGYLGDRLVARLLARPRDHADRDLGQPLVELGAHGGRSGAALAARGEGHGQVSDHLLEVQDLASSSTPPARSMPSTA